MRAAVLSLLLAATLAAPAFAQQVTPFPRYVVDVRAFMTNLGHDSITAAGLGVTPAQLPGHGFGGTLGAQIFPGKLLGLRLGIGGEAIIGRGRSQPTDPTNPVPIPPIEQRLRGVAGGFSLNFGTGDGWSYVSAGAGPLRFDAFNGPHPPANPQPAQLTIDLGAGARWFSSRHFAFCFEIREYYTNPATPTATSPGSHRAHLLVLSTGIAIR